MSGDERISRRAFCALAAGAAGAVASRGQAKQLPVGLEMFSVRHQLEKDLPGTVKAVAGMGYQGLEFFAPYFSWKPDYAREVRKQLDDLGIRCFSTHNGPQSFTADGLKQAAELNHILGSGFVVWASAGNVKTLDGWKKVAGTLDSAAAALAGEGLRTGYHNHQLEFRPIEGKRPIEVLAANTRKSVMLQLDVGTCIEAGSDPVAWIEQNPGRINALHLKEWSPNASVGYKALFGEGVAPWMKIFAAAESVGGAEYYLIEQEGSRYPELETAKKCLEAYRKLRGMA